MQPVSVQTAFCWFDRMPSHLLCMACEVPCRQEGTAHGSHSSRAKVGHAEKSGFMQVHAVSPCHFSCWLCLCKCLLLVSSRACAVASSLLCLHGACSLSFSATCPPDGRALPYLVTATRLAQCVSTSTHVAPVLFVAGSVDTCVSQTRPTVQVLHKPRMQVQLWRTDGLYHPLREINSFDTSLAHEHNVECMSVRVLCNCLHVHCAPFISWLHHCGKHEAST